MYAKGATAYFYVEFRNPETDALEDPATVRFKYETPALAETTLTYPDTSLVRQSTGKYRAAVVLNVASFEDPTTGAWKTWTFRWEPPGEAGETEFQRDVAPSTF